MKKIDIGVQPAEIQEGMMVRLTASTPAPAKLSQCKWSVAGPGLFSGGALESPDPPQPGVILWDTTGLQSGRYRISVQATLAPADSKGAVAGTDGAGEIDVQVRARLFSAQDVDGLARRAKDFALELKSNIDGKMDSLHDAINSVAFNVKTFDENLSASTRSVRNVALQRSAAIPTTDTALYVAIRQHAQAIGFPRYNDFINNVLCAGQMPDFVDLGAPSVADRRNDLNNRPTIHGVDAYNLLRLATEVFLILECGLVIRNVGPNVYSPEDERTRLGDAVPLAVITDRLRTYLGQQTGAAGGLPYLLRIVEALLPPDRRAERLPYCDGILQHRLSCPSMIELIWSYWHEEGMLTQTINAISLRFQNKRSPGGRDPLGHMEIDPLRPLNNIFWGHIQNEYSRLTVPRRAYEYDHHYGLTLYGKAVPPLHSADSRSKFIEAFHSLLYRTHLFYQEEADTTVIAAGFPLLNALRAVHLLLAEGAHNQFGDLPWTARIEMLIEQWLLSRPELREFLRGRAMVPYREAWMGQVDTMKRLQGWTDVTVTHFNDLAVYGEQILLSIRYGDWSVVNDQEQARNWARYWRPEVQGYIYAYQMTTGVDLTADPAEARDPRARTLPPSVHLRNRMVEQQKRT
jgi:hypothetical protein